MTLSESRSIRTIIKNRNMYVPHHNRSLAYKTLKIFPSLLFYFHNFEYCYYIIDSGVSVDTLFLALRQSFPPRGSEYTKKCLSACILTLKFKSISYAHNLLQCLHIVCAPSPIKKFCKLTNQRSISSKNPIRKNSKSSLSRPRKKTSHID